MTNSSVQFVVHGVPAPQAGTRQVDTAKGKRQISTGGVGLQAWRNDCAAEAEKASRAQGERGPSCFDEPVIVQAYFRFPMPKSRPKWMRDEGTWAKQTTPDLDKLCRALGDSLKTGGLIRDDSLIVEWRARKDEVWNQWTGVVVLIKPAITDEEEEI